MANERDKREQLKKHAENTHVYAPTHKNRPEIPRDSREDAGRTKQKKQVAPSRKTKPQPVGQVLRERREKKNEEHVSIHRMENMSRQHLKQAALEQIGKTKAHKEEAQLEVPGIVAQQEPPQKIPGRAELRKKQK